MGGEVNIIFVHVNFFNFLIKLSNILLLMVALLHMEATFLVEQSNLWVSVNKMMSWAEYPLYGEGNLGGSTEDQMKTSFGEFWFLVYTPLLISAKFTK